MSSANDDTVANDNNSVVSEDASTDQGVYVDTVVRLAEEARSYDPSIYEELPRAYRDRLDLVASELFNPQGGHVIVSGSPSSGKTLFINQFVGNVDRYLDKLDWDKLRFLRITSGEVNAIIQSAGGFDEYLSHVCDLFSCQESEVCFITEEPGVAQFIFETNRAPRVILEINNATLGQLATVESMGGTKMWGAWHLNNVDFIHLKKTELVTTMDMLVSEQMSTAFKVTVDEVLIRKFVNYVLRRIDLSSKETGHLITAPVGLWAKSIQRLAGMMSLSESLAQRDIFDEVLSEYADMFEMFSLDSQMPNISVLLDGSTPGSPARLSMGDTPIRIVPVLAGRGMGGPGNDEEVEVDHSPLQFSDMNELPAKLAAEVIGQDDVINSVVDGLVVPAAGMNDDTKPIRSFLFLGQTGVGKTKLATTLAENLTTEPMNVIRLDMSEFSQPHEAAKLFGAPPGYMGYTNGGILTNAVSEHPKSLIILDEIEKADARIWDSFLQILDAARMTDGTGEVVDFRQTVIVMTSNLGANEATKIASGFGRISSTTPNVSEARADAQKTIIAEVERHFRPELINRIDEIIVFNNLTKDISRQIVRKELALVSERMSPSGFTLGHAGDDIVDALLELMNFAKYGAREVQRTVLKNVSTPVARFIMGRERDAENEEANVVSLSLDGNRIIAS